MTPGEIAQIVSAVAAVIAACSASAAVVVSVRNTRKINGVHVDINSRMDQLLKERGTAQRAEGFREGREGLK